MPLTITASEATFTVSSPKSKYGVAVACPIPSGLFPNERIVVIEATATDIPAPSVYCQPSSVVTMTINYDVTAVPGAQQAELTVGNDVGEYYSGLASTATVSNVTPGTQDIAVAAYGATVSSPPYGLQIVRGQNVSETPLILTPMATSEETTPQAVTTNGVPPGFTNFVLAMYITPGGATIPISGNGVPSYSSIAPGDVAAGDFYSVLASALDSSTNRFVQSLRSFPDAQALTLTLPSPLTFSGPVPAAYPAFNAVYSGFTGVGNTGWMASLGWVEPPSGFRQIMVYATSNFLGSTGISIPDLSSVSGFFPDPSSSSLVGWSLTAFQQSDYYLVYDLDYGPTIAPPNETAQYAVAGGSFIVP